MLCFSSILTSDSQFLIICYSIFLYNSLYWYCTAILKFLISQFSILNSQLLATAVLCISISQLVILNSQLYWYCTAILKFLKFSVLSSQFSILNSQLLATAVFCFSISQIVILNSQLLNYFTAFSHLILVTGTMLYFSNIPDITAFFSYSSLAAMNLLSQIFLPCLPHG